MGQVFLSATSNPVFNEMTGAQRRILYLLDLKGPNPMSQIARLVGCTLPAATGVVDKLVRSGQVERIAAPEDRRIVKVALTETGRQTLAELKKVHEQRLAEVLAHLSPEKRDELIHSFAKIHDILSELEDVECV